MTTTEPTADIQPGFASVTFEVIGEPEAKKRHRCACEKGKVRTYAPADQRNAEAVIQAAWLRSGGRPDPNPKQLYGLVVQFELGRSRARKDADNLLKMLLDSLNRWAWVDDRQVVQFTVSIRRDSERPRTVCRIYKINEA